MDCRCKIKFKKKKTKKGGNKLKDKHKKLCFIHTVHSNMRYADVQSDMGTAVFRGRFKAVSDAGGCGSTQARQSNFFGLFSLSESNDCHHNGALTRSK